jgi:hypothetical protein
LMHTTVYEELPRNAYKIKTASQADISVMMKDKTAAAQLPPQIAQQIHDELYKTLLQHNLYIAEPALKRWTLWLINVLQSQAYTRQALGVTQYLTDVAE